MGFIFTLIHLCFFVLSVYLWIYVSPNNIWGFDLVWQRENDNIFFSIAPILLLLNLVGFIVYFHPQAKIPMSSIGFLKIATIISAIYIIISSFLSGYFGLLTAMVFWGILGIIYSINDEKIHHVGIYKMLHFLVSQIAIILYFVLFYQNFHPVFSVGIALFSVFFCGLIWKYYKNFLVLIFCILSSYFLFIAGKNLIL